MNLLIYDGWRIAQVRVIYAPEPKPSERLTWRIVCRESDRDADTEKTLALFPLPGAIVPTPPARIEKLISIFDLLNFAARRCARAFDPDKERDALAVLSEDVKCWTGTTLPDAALTGLLRLVHDELATDDEGRPPTQYFNGLDHVRLVKFVEAIATATGETVNGIRRKMLAAQVKSFVDLPDADSIQYLAVFKTESDSRAIPVEYYIVDDWSVEDRSRVEPNARLKPLAADRLFRAEVKALLAAQEKESAARHAELLETIKTEIASAVVKQLAPLIANLSESDKKIAAAPTTATLPDKQIEVTEVLLWKVQREIENDLEPGYRIQPGANAIFSAYCRDHLGNADIARKLKCDEKLVDRRLADLRQFLSVRFKLTLEAFRVDTALWQAANRELATAHECNAKLSGHDLAD